MNETTTPDIAEIEEALSRVPLFSRLEAKNLRKLAKLCVPTTFTAGDTVLEEGAIGLGLFLVTRGTIEIFRSGEEGRVDLGTAGAGDILGEIALVDDQPRTASAVASTATECLLLTRDSFDTLVKKDPAIAWCIVPGLAERIRLLHERLSDAEGSLSAEPPAGAESGTGAETDASAGDAADLEDEEDDEASDWSSTMARMLRMQYGLMAGMARGMTRSAEVMESFMDELADETDMKDNDSWNEIMEKLPDAMISATRKALEECEDMPQEMADAFRRYSKEN